MHPPNPSFKLAAWLPRPFYAPSQPARRDMLNVTVPPLRLSGEAPESRSGDANDWQVEKVAKQRRRSAAPVAISYVSVLLTVMPLPAVGREHLKRHSPVQLVAAV